MRELLAIGIGMGKPEQLTLEAVDALGSVQVFFLFVKDAQGEELLDARKELVARFGGGLKQRVVELADPPRRRDDRDYLRSVQRWREARARALETAIERELPDGGCGGVLVWGDPSLYDGTLELFEAIAARGRLAIHWRVIPGITSAQALAARRRRTLHPTGGELLITTGRRVAAGRLPERDLDLLVMLDSGAGLRALQRLPERQRAKLEIAWGAYLGMEGELTLAGGVSELLEEIADQRERCRRRRGWIMDTYLLSLRDDRRQPQPPRGAARGAAEPDD
jgi:precorrin-6A synthase